MPIKEIYKNNEVIKYQIKASARSKENSLIRAQKQQTICAIKYSRKKADNIYESLYREAIEEVKEKEGKDMIFSTLLDLWYENKIKLGNVTKETAGDYYNAMEKWGYSLLKKPCNDIRVSDIKSILNHQRDKGISRSYRRKFKSMLNNVFTFGMEEGYLTQTVHSPAYGIKLEKEAEKVPEILSTEQIRVFLKAAKEVDHEWFPIWAFAILSGCRNGEIYALRKDAVDIENNKITISQSYNNRRREIKSTKSGFIRTVPMNKQLRGLVTEQLNTNNGSEFLFPRIKGWDKGYQAKVLRTFLISIGLPSVKFHTLRACFATQLLQQGKAPAVVMKICGWRELKTMKHYVRLAGIEEIGATDDLNFLPEIDNSEVIQLNAN